MSESVRLQVFQPPLKSACYARRIRGQNSEALGTGLRPDDERPEGKTHLTNIQIKGYDSTMKNLSDAALQLELEKAQRLIRMIEAEIRWRRALELEKEVRKEMILEREMTMRRANGLGFLLEEPPALPQESCFALLGLNAFNMAPSPRPAEINATTMKRESEGSKEKLIVLPKPNQISYEGKRKAEMEKKNSESEEFKFELKKKAKEVKVVEEWRCELCNILTTSERVLNDHFKGKKHIAKEKAQSRKTVSANPSSKSVVSSCSKMDAKSEMKEEEEVENNSMNSGVKKH